MSKNRAFVKHELGCSEKQFRLQEQFKTSVNVGTVVTRNTNDLAPNSVVGEGKLGVLLLNLGGLETLDDVQPFLFNLISDPDIFRLPRLFRFLHTPLAQFISVARAPKSKEGYASIGGGSPLRQITDAQCSWGSTSLCDDPYKAEMEECVDLIMEELEKGQIK